MRLLANENFPATSVRLLREAGHDVVYVAEDFRSVGDDVVLQQAHDQARILLTFDRDYGELIFRRRLPAPAGVIYMRFEPQTPHEPAALVLTLAHIAGLQLDGWFTVLTREEIRQRRLP